MGGISGCRFTVEGFKLPQTTDFRVSDVLDSEISAAAIPNPHQIQHTVVSYINDQILAFVCHRTSRFRVLDILDIKISILARMFNSNTHISDFDTLGSEFDASNTDLMRPTVLLTRPAVVSTRPAVI